MDIRTGNHFNQRHTTAVEVNHSAVAFVVQQLACILLEMDALKTDPLGLAIHFEIHITVFTDRYIKLGNLVCLRQVRIEIVLTVGLAQSVDGTMGCNAHLCRIVYHLLVEHRQCTRLTGAYRAYMCIDFCTEGSAAAAENFCLG